MKNTLDEELIGLIFRSFRALKQQPTFANELGSLTLLQINTLIFIEKNKKPQINNVAEYFGISMPTTTSLINRLSRAKLVRRERDKKDRRIVHLSLTPKGLKLLKQTMEERKKVMKAFLSFLSLDDKKDLIRILSKVVNLGYEKS